MTDSIFRRPAGVPPHRPRPRAHGVTLAVVIAGAVLATGPFGASIASAQEPPIPLGTDSATGGPAPDTLGALVVADTETPADDVVRDVVHRPIGPLRTAERNPLYHLFLTPTVEGTEVLERGEWKVGLAAAYSNIFEYNFSDTFEQRFDLERSTTVISLARGFGGGLELGVSAGLQHNWGGFLDPAIQEIHDLFGLPNADREKVDNGQFGVYLGSRRGPPRIYLDLPSGTGLEAPRVWAAWRVAGGPGARGDVTLRTTVKLPGGDHWVSSRKTDLAVEVAVRRSWGPTHLHLSGGIVRFGLPEDLAPIMREGAWFGSAGVERGVTESFSVIGQFFGGSRYAAGFGFGELDNLPFNLALGGRGRLGGGWTWQVSFTEDVPPNSPSVDFTLDVALTRTWSPG